MTEQLGTSWVSGENLTRIQMIGMEDIEFRWGIISDLLMESREQWSPHYLLNGIKGRLVNGSNQFWVAADIDGPFIGMLTEIVTYETGRRELRVLWLGGYELKNMDQYFFVIEEWARIQNCPVISTHCRPGVKRMMEKYGFKDRSYSIEKNITIYKEQ